MTRQAYRWLTRFSLPLLPLLPLLPFAALVLLAACGKRDADDGTVADSKGMDGGAVIADGGRLRNGATELPDGGGHDGDRDAGSGDAAIGPGAPAKPLVDSGRELPTRGEGDAAMSRPFLSLRALCEMAPTNISAYCFDDDPASTFCDNEVESAKNQCAALLRAVDGGRLTYDGHAAAECLAASDEGWIPSVLHACGAVFSGRVAAGDDCYISYWAYANECGSGLFCDQTGSTCPGKCKAYQEQGETCDDEARTCGPRLMCVRTCDWPCDGTCRARPKVGEPCDITGGICATAELYCATDATPPTCATVRAEGSSCKSHPDCASHTCIEGKCIVTDRECNEDRPCPDGKVCGNDGPYWRCIDYPLEGEMCAGVSQACAEGLQCLIDHVAQEEICQSRAGVDGEPCLPWGCDIGHFCLEEGNENYVCRRARKMGEVCEEPTRALPIDGAPSCENGLHCMLSGAGTCLPPGELGEPCYYNDQESCVDGLVCPWHRVAVCEVPGQLGDICNAAFTNACIDGRCDRDCADPATCDTTCLPLLNIGERCKSHGSCASNYCNRHVAAPECGLDPGPFELCPLPL